MPVYSREEGKEWKQEAGFVEYVWGNRAGDKYKESL